MLTQIFTPLRSVKTSDIGDVIRNCLIFLKVTNMEKLPEQQISQAPNPEDAKRLKFEEDEEWYEYGRIPYEVYYMTDCPSGAMVDEKTPGRFKVTQNSGGGE